MLSGTERTGEQVAMAYSIMCLKRQKNHENYHHLDVNQTPPQPQTEVGSINAWANLLGNEEMTKNIDKTTNHMIQRKNYIHEINQIKANVK